MGFGEGAFESPELLGSLLLAAGVRRRVLLQAGGWEWMDLIRVLS